MQVVRLLSGEAVLLDERRAPPFDIDPPDDEEQVRKPVSGWAPSASLLLLRGRRCKALKPR